MNAQDRELVERLVDAVERIARQLEADASERFMAEMRERRKAEDKVWTRNRRALRNEVVLPPITTNAIAGPQTIMPRGVR